MSGSKKYVPIDLTGSKKRARDPKDESVEEEVLRKYYEKNEEKKKNKKRVIIDLEFDSEETESEESDEELSSNNTKSNDSLSVPPILPLMPHLLPLNPDSNYSRSSLLREHGGSEKKAEVKEYQPTSRKSRKKISDWTADELKTSIFQTIDQRKKLEEEKEGLEGNELLSAEKKDDKLVARLDKWEKALEALRLKEVEIAKEEGESEEEGDEDIAEESEDEEEQVELIVADLVKAFTEAKDEAEFRRSTEKVLEEYLEQSEEDEFFRITKQLAEVYVDRTNNVKTFKKKAEKIIEAFLEEEDEEKEEVIPEDENREVLQQNVIEMKDKYAGKLSETDKKVKNTILSLDERFKPEKANEFENVTKQLEAKKSKQEKGGFVTEAGKGFAYEAPKKPGSSSSSSIRLLPAPTLPIPNPSTPKPPTKERRLIQPVLISPLDERPSISSIDPNRNLNVPKNRSSSSASLSPPVPARDYIVLDDDEEMNSNVSGKGVVNWRRRK